MADDAGTRALTPTSYVVLGLVHTLQPCTSYDMKQLVKISIGNFWSFPHSQLYAEPARLVSDGLLVEEQEEVGRRRRLYRLTDAGESAFRDWARLPAQEIGELRDEGLLKLFFSDTSDRDAVVELAHAQVEVHEERIRTLTRLRDEVRDEAAPAQLATLELGLRWDRTAADFWAEVAEDPPGID
ncbi:PadR family transcriptional regulator [Actinospongicola halichondriae]|uniref:PadR family transcriptional regulator n=1 Tax=Actinospongicola halichondriae TaxID=3236844 RepID=UPI003D3AE7CF